MASMPKRTRDTMRSLSQVAQEYDCTVSGPKHTGSTHHKWTITHKSGRHRFLITSLTPSDYRTEKQRITELKKLCRRLVETN